MAEILEFLTRGEGSQFVWLVHGYLGRARNLLSLAGRIAEALPGTRVMLPDQLGHGSSPRVPEGAGLDTLADALARTIRRHGDGEPAWVIGHSLGGRVAMQLTQSAPELVRRATVMDIGPAPILRSVSHGIARTLAEAPAHFERRNDARDYLLAAGLERPIAMWLLTNLEALEDGGYGWLMDRAALHEIGPRLNAVDLWHVVETRLRPMHFIRGGDSPYVDDAMAERLGSAGHRVDTVPDAGHFLHVDQPAAVVKLLTG